jgi:hypothetical protein
VKDKVDRSIDFCFLFCCVYIIIIYFSDFIWKKAPIIMGLRPTLMTMIYQITNYLNLVFKWNNFLLDFMFYFLK